MKKRFIRIKSCKTELEPNLFYDVVLINTTVLWYNRNCHQRIYNKFSLFGAFFFKRLTPRDIFRFQINFDDSVVFQLSLIWSAQALAWLAFYHLFQNTCDEKIKRNGRLLAFDAFCSKNVDSLISKLNILIRWIVDSWKR